MEKKWCVYILECLDGSFYTGVSNDVEARMKAHREGSGSKYVRSRGFKELVFVRECKDKSEAFALEYKVKLLKRDEKVDFLKRMDL